jgi:ribonuclease HI
MKWYGVHVGRIPGVYENWNDCKAQTDGFSGAVFKSFGTYDAALEFSIGDRGTVRTSASSPHTTPIEIRKPAKPTEDTAAFKTSAPRIAAPISTTSQSGAVFVYFDGGSRGNGSHDAIAGCGWVLLNSTRKIIVDGYERIANGSTNNEAEYMACIRGLEEAKRLGARDITLLGDSKLVISQLNGSWKVSTETLRPYHRAATELVKCFRSVSISWIPREENSEADKLSNMAMDSPL